MPSYGGGGIVTTHSVGTGFPYGGGSVLRSGIPSIGGISSGVGVTSLGHSLPGGFVSPGYGGGQTVTVVKGAGAPVGCKKHQFIV